MATAFVASTPTRSGSPASINTPPTPRLGGFGDNWEPYSPAPRKSARLSSRTTDNCTPSPHSGRKSRPSQPRTSPKASSSSEPQSHQSDNTTSPPTTSPQKKRQPPSASRSVSGSLTAESIRNAAAALGQTQEMEPRTHLSRAALALPTPAKTPADRHSKQSEKDVTAIARNLFSKPQQSPKKSKPKPKPKHGGDIALGSFEIHDDEAPIEIFTDSENRLPEVDDSTENPFYGEAGIAASMVAVRRSSRNKKNAAVEKEIVEEKLKRDDGLLYVFRGKKVFRKFTDGESSSRPAVKPRLLFPPTKATKENKPNPEEEAETDIDEHAQVTEKDVETPAEAFDEKVDTPKAPKFAPASPPATSRATRSKKLSADEPTPIKIKGKRAGGRSPFDGWQRTKNSPSTSVSGQKRAGDPLANDAPSKRAKA